MKMISYLCSTLFLSRNELMKFVRTSPYRYKTYKIPKRNGNGVREISQPSKELKHLQRVSANYLLSDFPISDSAFAYIKECNIKENALVHLKSNYLLKMDFKDFFPSISPKVLLGVIRGQKVGLTVEEEKMVIDIFFKKNRVSKKYILSIGAPSSPIISNVIMYDFDEQVKSLCSELDINYSRYSDDIFFSCNKKGLLFDMPEKIKILLQDGFNGQIIVNDKKTVFTSKAHNRHITGITLTNDNRLSVGRERKRLLRAMVHRFTMEALDKKEIAYLQGILAFAKFIEPNFYYNLSKKYTPEVLRNIRASDDDINEKP